MGQEARVIKHTTPGRCRSYFFFCAKLPPLKEVMNFPPDFLKILYFVRFLFGDFRVCLPIGLTAT
ncbi:MAG: hypothetical protein DRP56_03860 [Planctomycetota bacterium]|nr:MAG: hypothetical protein DRP56_03860 [Planctomycetota bacterium]RKY13991.1 MAG: hypothetical protein DRP52_01310 [Planctomycetota bacterium]